MKNYLIHRYSLRRKPLKIKIKIKKIFESTGNMGQCWPYQKNKRMEIDPRQRPKDYMDTVIHEALHLIFPDKKEKRIMWAGTTIANLLWRLGYRRVKKRKKKLTVKK